MLLQSPGLPKSTESACPFHRWGQRRASAIWAGVRLVSAQSPELFQGNTSFFFPLELHPHPTHPTMMRSLRRHRVCGLTDIYRTSLPSILSFWIPCGPPLG